MTNNDKNPTLHHCLTQLYKVQDLFTCKMALYSIQEAIEKVYLRVTSLINIVKIKYYPLVENVHSILSIVGKYVTV